MSTLNVVDCALITSLGDKPANVASAVEAKINRFAEVDFGGFDGEPIIMAAIPSSAFTYPPAHIVRKYRQNPKQYRLLALALTALKKLNPTTLREPLALFLAGPEALPAAGGLKYTFLKNLAEASELQFNDYSRISNMGRVGICEMASLAERYMETTGAPYALIGAVDTFYDQSTLEFLRHQNRLLPASSDGFIPGEAAVFLLLTSQAVQPTALSGKTLGIHSVHIHCGDKGEEALAKTITAITPDSRAAVNVLYSCVNGEYRFVNELAIAITRHHGSFAENYEIVRASESLGDLGAASGAAMIVLANERIQHSKTRQNILLCCSSDQGTRAVMCLTSDPISQGESHDAYSVCQQT